MSLDDLYQQIILEHNRNPRGAGAPAGANRHATAENPFCGDRVTVHVRLRDDVIEDIGCEAQSCAIAKASASMLTVAVRGLRVADVVTLAQRFAQLVNGQPVADEGPLGELAALRGVAAFPVRIACAILPWTALAQTLGPLER